MSPSTIDYLKHIRDQCDLALNAQVSLEAFAGDRYLRLAMERCIETIGEAVKHFPPALLAANPDVPWRLIIRMRDKLAHGYFDIDDRVLIEVIHDHLPLLRAVIERLIQTEEFNRENES